MSTPYNTYGIPNVSPGMAVSSDAVHRAGIYTPNPIFSSATFSGNALALLANAQYQVTVTDTLGNIFNSALFTIGATVDVNQFHTWFASAIAPQFSISTGAAIWNTGGVHTVSSNAGYFNLGSLNQTITLTRTNVAPTTVTLATIAPRSNNGVAQLLPGRFVVRDVVVEQTLAASPALANFSTRETHIPIRLMDTGHFASHNFRHLLGVTGVVPITGNPTKDQTGAYGIFDTVRVFHRGSLAVKASTTASFSGALPNQVLLELAPGANQGTVTNIASGSTVAIPDTIIQIENVRTYPGIVIVRFL